MAKDLEVYKCELCGNVLEVLTAGPGPLVCCGQPMQLLVEKSTDEGNEKHVPVVEKTDDGYLVKVGSVGHPMDDNHYISWIQLLADGVSYRKNLKPGDKPEALFCVDATTVSAREYCTLHSLWKSK